MLNSLEVVDELLFDKQNYRQILLLEPDTYVKSTDYNYDSMNKEERNALEKVGSKIFFVPLLEKHSTSLIISKIKDMNIKRSRNCVILGSGKGSNASHIRSLDSAVFGNTKIKLFFLTNQMPRS